MTTHVQARDILVQDISLALSLDHPSTRVFYENSEKIDVNTVGDMFMQVGVEMLATKQVSIESAPHDRTMGQVKFRLHYKEGRGSRNSLVMFDYLKTRFKHRALSGVTTGTPTPGGKGGKDGWAYFDFLVPFTFDSTP